MSGELTVSSSVKVVNGRAFRRIPVRTHLIQTGEDIAEVVRHYTKPLLQQGDIVFVSEKATAASQGRAYYLSEIRPGFWAQFLYRFVKKVPYGIGLGSPYTMQMAIQECGLLRILLAAAVHVFSKYVLGRSGDFYRVAGMQAALIDGPVDYALPPFNKMVVLGPKEPNKVACRIAEVIGVSACIIDANDIGGAWVIGASPGVDCKLVEQIVSDNPLGQTTEQTPIGIIREETVKEVH